MTDDKIIKRPTTHLQPQTQSQTQPSFSVTHLIIPKAAAIAYQKLLITELEGLPRENHINHLRYFISEAIDILKYIEAAPAPESFYKPKTDRPHKKQHPTDTYCTACGLIEKCWGVIGVCPASYWDFYWK